MSLELDREICLVSVDNEIDCVKKEEKSKEDCVFSSYQKNTLHEWIDARYTILFMILK